MDERSQVRTELCFWDAEGGRLFIATTLPRGRPRAGVVVCSPIKAEHSTIYDIQSALAWALAERGFAVQRFHYRGEGESEGQPDELSFEGMCQDARLAWRRLEDRTGTSPVAFVGARVGGTVAATLRAEAPDAPLVIWDPIPDPAAYFREVYRYRLLADLPLGGSPRSSFQTELDEQGSVHVLGFQLHRRLYESFLEASLEKALAGSTGPVLLVQLGGGIRSRSDELANSLRGSGFSLDSSSISGKLPWWLHHASAGSRIDEEALISASADWLTERAGGSG